MAKATLTVDVSENDHIQGPANAPVTLVEYGDYECPHCAEADEVVKDLQQRLGDRLRFVYRNFPLTQSHRYAEIAAEAAESAAAQDRFWEMHDTLYDNQPDLTQDDLVRYAGEIGLDREQFTADLESSAYADKVEADFTSGAESGVNGTPTFFVNGVRFDGDWRGDDLYEALAGDQSRSARQ